MPTWAASRSITCWAAVLIPFTRARWSSRPSMRWRAIILLSTTPKECCVFHTYNNHALFLGDVLSGLNNIGTDIRFVEDEEYNSAMESAGNDPQKAKTLSSLLAYKDAAHGKKAASVPVVNAYTTQVLYRLGFKWSPTTWDYVDQMLGTISGLGFFD